jgi:hypothetical protein
MLGFKRFAAGETVRGGFYWNRRAWEAQVVAKEGTLEGAEGTQFIRVPVVAVLFLAPLMGAAYAMFLPFIGFAMLGAYVWNRVNIGARVAGHGTVTK